MSKKLVEMLEKTVDRRAFLSKAAAACTAFTAGLVGFARPARAHYRHVYCCHLCTVDCPSTYSCACWWSWTCCHSGNTVYCRECFYSSSSCGNHCNGIRCSHYFHTSISC